jgi:hypothetical protein
MCPALVFSASNGTKDCRKEEKCSDQKLIREILAVEGTARAVQHNATYHLTASIMGLKRDAETVEVRYKGKDGCLLIKTGQNGDRRIGKKGA